MIRRQMYGRAGFALAMNGLPATGFARRGPDHRAGLR
jgi:hypothetical protein